MPDNQKHSAEELCKMISKASYELNEETQIDIPFKDLLLLRNHILSLEIKLKATQHKLILITSDLNRAIHSKHSISLDLYA